jgi:hypothetical protein
MSQKPRGAPLPPETLAALRALVGRLGLRRVAELTGVSVNAIRQASAGFCVLHGTTLAVADGLRRGDSACQAPS